MKEIMQILGGGETEEEQDEWREIINEIDRDGNGEISFDEFHYMMLKLI